MALSTGLIKRLNSDNGDEPLTKRLKIAENIFSSVEIPIPRKEDCIVRWLCSEISNENINLIWSTIHRCLVLDPKTLLRLSFETRNLLITKLTTIISEYPDSNISDEMLKCCICIFSVTNVQNFVKDNRIPNLMESLLIFASKVFSLNISKSVDKILISSDLVIECVENAIHNFSQICRQSFSEKKKLMVLFIQKILFPLAIFLQNLKSNNLTSKVFMDTQKCIKRLLFGSIQMIKSSSNDNNEKLQEAEFLFATLKTKIALSTIEDIKAALSCLFQCVVYNFQQNSVFIDAVLRKLVECTDQKEHSKQILTALLENSIEVSYNFEHEIEGISFKTFLKIQIEEIIKKKKKLKLSDFSLVCAIAKLNPVIVEDITESILKKILFEDRANEKEELLYESVLKELWIASVRLRRQNKFLSKFLLIITQTETDNLKLKNIFELPKEFVNEFSKDLKSHTTSSQILAMFNTLYFHFKSDCVNKLKTLGPTTQVCLAVKIVSTFLVTFFENTNFLDTSLPHDWQNKFYHTFADLRDSLALFVEILINISDKCETVLFKAFSDIVKIWCELYDLLRFYVPDVINDSLDFPINESQFNDLKRIVKQSGEHSCKEALNQLVFYKSVIFERCNEQLRIKDKLISSLWSDILEDHFPVIENFNEIQLIKLTSCLVHDINSADDKLVKWMSILKQNTARMSKLFVTSIVFQVMFKIVQDIKLCSTKSIIETIDIENVLKSLPASVNLNGTLKSSFKKIAKLHFQPVEQIDLDKTIMNLNLLGKLPISFLDFNIRKFLFTILYTFEEETKASYDLSEFTKTIYIDCLRQNDLDILNFISEPSIIINHFKHNQLIFVKLCKLSLNNNIIFWESFIDTEECSRKISCILLKCIDTVKSKSVSNEHKTALQSLSVKLSNKLINTLSEEVNDPYDIAGLRISLKILFSQEKKIKKKVKNHVAQTLKNALQTMDKQINDNLIKESLQLSLIVLTHRNTFDVNEDLIQLICNIIITNVDIKNFSYFFEVLKDNEFEYFVKFLVNQTNESLTNCDETKLEQLITIWEILSKSKTKSIYPKSSVYSILINLLGSEIKETSVIFLLKLCRAFATSKRTIRLSDKIIDSIFITSTQSLNNVKNDSILIVCQEALGLCLDLIRSQPEFILDRLPILTNLFIKVFRIILEESKEVQFLNDHVLRILAVDITKFCIFFAKLKKDVVRISPYLIADIIEKVSEIGALPPFLKDSIDSSMSHLLSNCDHHAVSYLKRTLPSSTQQVFNTIYANYTKYQKYTGKI